MTTLKPLLRGKTTAMWFVLVGATLVSAVVGTDDRLTSKALATTLVLTVAFAKVRLVGLYFMELRSAPRALRGIFEAYCVIVWALLLTLYYAS